MSIIKIITGINWVLISIYGALAIWALVQPEKPSHEMPGVESIIKVVGFVLLLILIGLNITSYPWMKIAALVIVILLLFIIRSFSDN